MTTSGRLGPHRVGGGLDPGAEVDALRRAATIRLRAMSKNSARLGTVAATWA